MNRSLRSATRSLRGATAVAGIGATPYYKRGTSPHSALRLTLEAILAACAGTAHARTLTAIATRYVIRFMTTSLESDR
jgi:hypothetical protein